MNIRTTVNEYITLAETYINANTTSQTTLGTLCGTDTGNLGGSLNSTLTDSTNRTDALLSCNNLKISVSSQITALNTIKTLLTDNGNVKIYICDMINTSRSVSNIDHTASQPSDTEANMCTTISNDTSDITTIAFNSNLANNITATNNYNAACTTITTNIGDITTGASNLEGLLYQFLPLFNSNPVDVNNVATACADTTYMGAGNEITLISIQ